MSIFYKHISAKKNRRMEWNGIHIFTPQAASQTDGFYIDKSYGLTVRNCDIHINNGSESPHCDGIQMFLCGGDVFMLNNFIEQNNAKTSNDQGIYGTTPVWDGGVGTTLYKYIGNTITGGSRGFDVKNCLTLRGLPQFGGVDVPIEVRGNTVIHNGDKGCWLTSITGFNSDLLTEGTNVYKRPNGTTIPVEDAVVIT